MASGAVRGRKPALVAEDAWAGEQDEHCCDVFCACEVPRGGYEQDAGPGCYTARLDTYLLFHDCNDLVNIPAFILIRLVPRSLPLPAPPPDPRAGAVHATPSSICMIIRAL